MRPVNLTPPDRWKTKKAAGAPGAPKEKTKLGPVHMAGAAILVGALALAYLGHSARGQANEKAAQADELEGQVQTLSAQITALKAKETAPATGAPDTYDTDRQLVTGLAAARVNWSTVSTNLARVAPSGVWLDSIKITTPSGDAAAAAPSGPTVKRPAAITVDAHALTRTDAALFISRLDAIPGFDQPRLNGGINPESGDAASGTGSATGPVTYKFAVEIPVDDAIFGTIRGLATPTPTAPAAGSATTTSTTSTSTPAGASSTTTTTTTTP